MFEKIFEQIKKYDSIVIFGHINPDGDCYGSQIAIRESLKLAFPEKRIFAVGSGYRRFAKMLGEMDIIDDSVISNSLAIIVDGNDLPRMEDQRVVNAKAWIKIDHHVDVGTFTEGEFVVDEDANSCCSIIARMVQELKLPINTVIASALFLGLLTDTGRFQFVSDFPSTFKLAGWLCENGADPTSINKILSITDEGSLSFKGYVYSHYKKTQAGTIYLAIDQKTLKRFNLTAGKAGAMVNLISNLKGYPIWAFFCENEDGSCHGEFRSNGPAVQPIAVKHGGGGHLQAAGATTPIFGKEIISEIVAEFDEAILNWKEQ